MRAKDNRTRAAMRPALLFLALTMAAVAVFMGGMSAYKSKADTLLNSDVSVVSDEVWVPAPNVVATRYISATGQLFFAPYGGSTREYTMIWFPGNVISGHEITPEFCESIRLQGIETSLKFSVPFVAGTDTSTPSVLVSDFTSSLLTPEEWLSNQADIDAYVLARSTVGVTCLFMAKMASRS